MWHGIDAVSGFRDAARLRPAIWDALAAYGPALIEVVIDVSKEFAPGNLLAVIATDHVKVRS